MDNQLLLDKIKEYKKISKDVFLFNKIKERLNKSSQIYSKELSQIVDNYKYSLKELKQISR